MRRMRRSLCMVLICVMTILSVGGFIPPMEVYAAEGTAIRTEQELRKIKSEGTYYLANDITLSGDWTPLESFRGILDGNGYKITGLSITKGIDDNYGASQYGLFTEIVSSGVVKNLGIEGTINITQVSEGVEWISGGLLAGTISNDYYNPTKEARIRNVWVKGEVKCDAAVEGKSLGAIAGVYSMGIGANCYSAVKGVPFASGLIGMTQFTNMFYDNTLYAGESDASIKGMSTSEMQDTAFLDRLNAATDEVEWIKGTDGYPVMKVSGDTETDTPATEEPDTSNVIEISNEAELYLINENLSADYKLTADIELTSEWTMIGSAKEPFSGTLDGDGYVITGLSYSGNVASIGLIDTLTGTVKNLGVEGTLVATGFDVDAIGGIAGINQGTIENCFGKVNITNKYATRSGAIAGNNINGFIKNCYGVAIGSKGPIAVGCSTTNPKLNYDNVFYDQTVFGKEDNRYGIVGKTTQELKSAEMLALLNENKGSNRTWVSGQDGYPALRMKKTEVSIDETKLKENIASNYYGSTDPWNIIELVGLGKADLLTNKEQFIKEAVAVVKDTSSSSYATDLEKYIIAVSALGIDATRIPDGETYVNAIEALGQIDFEDTATNAIIFALCAYDSGEYKTDKNAVQTKEELVQLLLDEQKTDGGWAFMGRVGDVDFTAMALHALSPYYLAADPNSVGLSDALYNDAKDAVERGIIMLSDAQQANGTFMSGSTVNANSGAMVVTALSSLGINANTDERFVKEGGSAYNALLMFASKNLDGFLWKLTDTKVNAMATEQAFRAMVSYEGFLREGNAFNIYHFGKLESDKVEEPEVTPTVEPT
ncbi:MAG: hypothetical protein Q4G58_10520, partial [bacterium]|nr:hypothetical protein [bacterium]